VARRRASGLRSDIQSDGLKPPDFFGGDFFRRAKSRAARPRARWADAFRRRAYSTNRTPAQLQKLLTNLAAIFTLMLTIKSSARRRGSDDPSGNLAPRPTVPQPRTMEIPMKNPDRSKKDRTAKGVLRLGYELLRNDEADLIAVPAEEVYGAAGLRVYCTEAILYSIDFLHGQSEVLGVEGSTEAELLAAVLRHAAQAAPDDPRYRNLFCEWLFDGLLPLPFIALADKIAAPVTALAPAGSLPTEQLAATSRRVVECRQAALAALREAIEASPGRSWSELEPIFSTAPQGRPS